MDLVPVEIVQMASLGSVALRLVLGGAVGFAIGLTGVGGGVLIVPVVVVALGF